ncbi:Cysteine--tRNA ligase [Fructobacillus sp. EFB-N1]|uniref:cysteine--tRNA ligase n=1 Tax=Fructobacillus sp. EFB-N1 TaxID=1658766 RepID=UPI00064D8FE5|nr:cysteine--tRNA ligase [Fructobacillus sp. EFB-N1]KMK52696.1 Cysteine--tRNA ligase [Fructobacillus sp. EFB-N1]
MLQVYNTYSLEKEDFAPQEAGKITMYLCGPTVYNYIHIGNARSAVAFDTIRRYLEWRGYEVNFVSNFTDLGDKVIAQGEKEGLTEQEVADKYAAAFAEDTRQLNIKPATSRPRATEYMKEMVEFVERLLEQGQAYEVNGNVYFSTKKFKNYTALSHQNMEQLEENAAGRLGEEDQEDKQDPTDFALWKSESRPDVVAWSSPWGPGRPGWHLECSVMNDQLLGETIDIHAGGIDLTFPHHTNELAQSESYHHRQFVRYWLHNGFVNVNDEKMSKSLGNFVTIHDLLKTDIDPQGLRFFLAKTNYRRAISYSSDRLDQTQGELDRLYRAYQGLLDANAVAPAGQVSEQVQNQVAELEESFIEAMDDDFNTENAVTVIFDLATLANKVQNQETATQGDLECLANRLQTWLGIFGIEQLTKEVVLTPDQEALLAERAAARAAKDFQTSDAIRDQLLITGLVVRDSPQGQTWELK